MALALPQPANPRTAPSSPRSRAYRQWLKGRDHAQREHWPFAATAFEQASALDDTDSAYALAAAHALIQAGRATEALQRARRLRLCCPRESLAYALEARALLALGRADESVQCLAQLPADVARDHEHLVLLAVSLQRCQRHAEAIAAFMNALAGKLDDAVSHFRLGMSFKELGMKSQAGECVRTAVLLAWARATWPRAGNSPSSTARLATGAPPARRWPHCAWPCRPRPMARRWKRARSRTRCWWPTRWSN